MTRDDLVGQYIGHTAPKTKEVLKKAMGGVLFIDEAYYLYRPENERDYGQEAIEILLQVMENQRDDLVVILAGYGERMDRFFESTRVSARASPITSIFPTIRTRNCSDRRTDLAEQNYSAVAGCAEAMSEYIQQPPGAAAFRQCPLDPQRAGPGAAAPGQPPLRNRPRAAERRRLSPIDASDIRASRVFDDLKDAKDVKNEAESGT